MENGRLHAFTSADLFDFVHIITRTLTLPPSILDEGLRRWFEEVLSLINNELYNRQAAPSPTYLLYENETERDDNNRVNSNEVHALFTYHSNDESESGESVSDYVDLGEDNNTYVDTVPCELEDDVDDSTPYWPAPTPVVERIQIEHADFGMCIACRDFFNYSDMQEQMCTSCNQHYDNIEPI